MWKIRRSPDSNVGQKNNGARGGRWLGGRWLAENPTFDAGCYTLEPSDAFELANGWSCPNGFPNQATALVGNQNNAYWQQKYAQEADMPFFMGEWGVPRQRYKSYTENNVTKWAYSGYDGSEVFFCAKFDAYEDPNGDGNTSDRIHWAVWSFDARVDGFGLYMSRPDGAVGKDFLTANQWADSGTFSATQAGWSGQSWNYAEPFSFGPNGCRQ